MADMVWATTNRGLVLLSERDRLRKICENVRHVSGSGRSGDTLAPEAARDRIRLSEVEEMLRAMGIDW